MQRGHCVAMPSHDKSVMHVSEVIQLQNVTFTYPDDTHAVLTDFSFTVRSGEKWLVKGPSGCGKSTLFFLLNGLYPEACDGIVTGERILFGKSYAEFKPGEVSQFVATVFQDPDSQFCMPTVEEELAFTLENRSIPRNEMDEQISCILQETGLTPFRHRVIQTLSGGEKQRVATACALLMEPAILLLDEPLAHLDPVTAKDYVAWFDGLQRKFGWTVLVIDHQSETWGEFFTHSYVFEEVTVPLVERQTYRYSSLEQKPSYSASLQVQGIIHDASIELSPGEITVLAGPNGSGKTTLLKALTGLIKSEGSHLKEAVGYVPQAPEFLFLNPTVQEEVAYGGGTKTAEYLQQFLLDHVAEANPFAVSQGQKRRTAAAAMLNDGRSILLLDEPTAGQDAYALYRLEQALYEAARLGMALLVVTHDMGFASRIADQMYLMKDGIVSGPFSPHTVFTSSCLLDEYRLLAPVGGETIAHVAPSYEPIH